MNIRVGRMNSEVDRTATLADVVGVLEEFYPSASAASWDKVGLVSGDPEQPVQRVRFAVDPTLAVI